MSTDPDRAAALPTAARAATIVAVGREEERDQ
ncbi:hypothetical protein Actkin_01768 [Actinokineospora sp. UTMC 2448]|nr:hypothetical protein Actkin_01768 [Actinokineospora sp. UTMC 2448]